MIIKRYLAREIFNTLFTVTFVLLLAFICQQAVRYLNYVAVGKIPTNVLLKLISFEVPYLLALLLPLGLYLGILLAYGRLYAENEMAILQLSGFGNRQLFRLTAVFAFVVMLFVLFLMLWVNPIISAKRQVIMSSDEATLHLIQTLIPGRFQASPDGKHVMYVEKLSRDHMRAKNVFMAQEKKLPANGDQTPWLLVHAAEGFQKKGDTQQDQFFVTKNGYRYEGTPGQSDFQIIQFGKYEVRIPENNAHNVHDESESLPSLKLWQAYQNPKHAAELQWRISIGILTFILALLAVPISFVRPRQGRYVILIPAIMVYIFYINLLFIARHWVEQEVVSITLGLWWVHGLGAFLTLTILIFYFSPRFGRGL